MKRLHFLALTCVCLGIAAMLLFRANTHAVAASPSSCGSWNVVHSPNIPGYGNTLNTSTLSGVATISANDIWSVGESYLDRETPSQTLIEHWNGTSWSIVHSPNVPSVYNSLNGVTAVSTNDVWAVGGSNDETLIEHWDGTTWSIVPSPNTGTADVLSGVSAVSANDIWAVGQAYLNPALIEHWNGSQWSVVPNPVTFSSLYSVTALSTSDVWAVGVYQYGTLVEHWDGSQWSVVPSPNPPSYGRIILSGVAAVSATNIWAVGEYGTNSVHSGTALIEHWNGKKWSLVPAAPTSERVALLAVAVISPTDIWAVGDTYEINTFTEHWNGTTWSVVPSPYPNVSFNSFDAVANIPGSNYVWAVGSADYITTNGNAPTDTLTAYYC
ncbi:MAG: beta propeller repeat protein [Ktedonobacteraceae bacterium]